MAMTAQGRTSSIYNRLGHNNTIGMAAERKATSVFNRLGKVSPPRKPAKKTCIYWAKGRCNKVNCPYLHSEQPAQKTNKFLAPKKQLTPPKPKTLQSLDTRTKQMLAPQIKQMVADHLKPCNSVSTTKRNMTWKNDNSKNGSPCQKQEPDSRTTASRKEDNDVVAIKCPNSYPVELKKDDKEVAAINCPESDPVELKKEAVEGTGLTKLTELKGHSKAIAGIALPSSSNKLYTGCMDKSVRVWDCSTGQCDSMELLNDEVVCMITRGPWLFAGSLNNIKAWNLDHRVECPLNVTGGRVHSMEFDNDVLFAGMEDGNILVWKRNPDTNEFELVAKTKSHSGPVLSLVMGHGRLYSASSDSSIQVWDQYMNCVQTLQGHTREVTSLVCYDKYVLSSSMDKTLKIWSPTESGNVEMLHELKEDHGFVSIGGIILRPDGQHRLLCSLDDKSVRLYDFSFVEKGRILSTEQAPVVQVGVDGLFFIGDEAGNISVWRLA